jgi:ABC-2 type transport system permease protein
MTVYDSATRSRPLMDELTNLWRYRGLLEVLVRRDIVLRYKRSLLGVWWTLLDPLLTTLVLWIVLSQVFKASIPGVPYVVYLYSGVVIFRCFEQATLTVGSSLVDSSGVLSRIYAPAEVFSVSSALAAGFNFAVGMIPLLILIVLNGMTIPWTIVLVPIPAVALLMFSAGFGLAVASLAVRFYDVLSFTLVALYLLGWLTPTFYPISSVGEQFQLVIKMNPLYSYLTVFRDLAYGGTFAPWWTWAVVGVTAVGAFVGGAWIFGRSWRTAAAMM